MATPTVDAPLARIPMSWTSYCDLDESTRGEYVGGHLVMVPSPTQHHQRICTRLTAVLEAAAPPGVSVSLGWAWSPAGSQVEFIPDVMVYPDAPDGPRFSGIPHLLVEVLSTNRSDDLTTKARLYAHHGAPRFWVVDPRDHVLVAFELNGTAYHRTARLTAGSKLLEVAGVSVDLNLDELLTPG